MSSGDWMNKVNNLFAHTHCVYNHVLVQFREVVLSAISISSKFNFLSRICLQGLYAKHIHASSSVVSGIFVLCSLFLVLTELFWGRGALLCLCSNQPSLPWRCVSNQLQ